MKNNKGITMIELITSMAILGIVGLMIAAVLSTSVRMYQSTITRADLQKESQTISRRIATAIMDAENLCIGESADGTFLFTGAIKEESSKTLYDGEIIWFNRLSNSLYYKAETSMEVAETSESGTAQTAYPLTAAVVIDALENGSDVREYLISENIESLVYWISPELEEADRIRSSDFYAMDEKVTVGYKLVLSDFNGDNYAVNSSTTPRNVIGYLYMKEENTAE